MRHDESRKAQVVDAWMKKAERDLALARHSLKADPPFTDSATFHCQQAVEKALKGYLAFHEKIFKKTHSIAELGGQVLEIDSSLEALIRKAIYLTPYATAFRYPGEPEEPTHGEALEAIAKYKAYSPDDDQVKKFKEVYDKLSHCDTAKKT